MKPKTKTTKIEEICPFCKKKLKRELYAGDYLYICDPCGNNFRYSDLIKAQEDRDNKAPIYERPGKWATSKRKY